MNKEKLRKKNNEKYKYGRQRPEIEYIPHIKWFANILHATEYWLFRIILAVIGKRRNFVF